MMSQTSPYVQSFIGAHVVLIRGEKVFLIRRFNTGFSDGKYSVPAGHVDDGELIVDAAIREAFEETGIHIALPSLQFVHVVHIRKQDPTIPDRMQCFFVCTKWDGEPMNREPEKCDHADWFPLETLPANMVTYVAQALQGMRAGTYFSHLDE